MFHQFAAPPDGEDTRMTGPPSHPNTRELGADPGGKPAAKRPRWRVIMFWTIGIVLVLLFIVLHLTGTLGSGAHG